MAVTSGFFNAVSSDRTYSAEQFGQLFTGIISDGVFHSVGQALRCDAVGGSTVRVRAGRAWCRGTWLDNSGDYDVSVQPNSSGTLERCDAIVLRFNKRQDVRANTIEYLRGVAAASAVKPALQQDALIYEMPIAWVRRPRNASSVSGADIQIAVGTTDCPYITGPLQTISVDAVTASLNSMISSLQQTTQKAVEQVEKDLKTAGDAKNQFTTWLQEAEASLGNSPNVSQITQALNKATSAESKAQTALMNSTQAASDAASARSTAEGVATKAQTALDKAQQYEVRLTTAETNAAKAAALVPRVEVLEKSQAKGGLRNNSLGNHITTDQYTDIHNGTFADVGVGSYWQLGDFNYEVVGMDCVTADFHHVVVMPAKAAFKSQYSYTDTISGGYNGSRLAGFTKTDWMNAMPAWNTAGFGPYVPSISERWSSGLTGANVTNSTTVVQYFGLPTETHIFGRSWNGQITPHEAGFWESQFELFRLAPWKRMCNQPYWLRNLKSNTVACGVRQSGTPDAWYVNNDTVYVRPYFLIGMP